MDIRIDFQNCSGFSSSQSAERPQETTSGKHSTMYVVFVLLSHEVVKDVALSGGGALTSLSSDEDESTSSIRRKYGPHSIDTS